QHVEPGLEPIPQLHQLPDPGVDLLQLGPVQRDGLRARAPLIERVVVQARHERENLVEGEPDGEEAPDPAHPLHHRFVELAVAVAPPRRLDQPLGLVVPERPHARARPPGQLPDSHVSPPVSDLAPYTIKPDTSVRVKRGRSGGPGTRPMRPWPRPCRRSYIAGAPNVGPIRGRV